MSYSEKRRDFKRQRIDNRSNTASWENLDRLTKKRFQTVFVGAVSKIEERFGHLWGSDEIDEENMTEQQLKYYNIFLELRDQIFDQGNDQRKKLMKEIGELKVKVSTKL